MSRIADPIIGGPAPRGEASGCDPIIPGPAAAGAPAGRRFADVPMRRPRNPPKRGDFFTWLLGFYDRPADDNPGAAGPAQANNQIIGGARCSWDFATASVDQEARHRSAFLVPSSESTSPAWGYVHYTVHDMWCLAEPVPVPDCLLDNVVGPEAPVHLFQACKNSSTSPGGQSVAERLIDAPTAERVMDFSVDEADALGHLDVPFVLKSVKLCMRTRAGNDLVRDQPPAKSIRLWRKQKGVKRARQGPQAAAPPADANSWEDILLELPRKRAKLSAEGSRAGAGALKDRQQEDPIKVIRGIHFARFLRSTRDFKTAMGAAHAYEHNTSPKARDSSMDQSRKTYDSAKAKLDVVATLLSRREFHADRICDNIRAIALYTDASPNCGLEFQGMVTDIFRHSGNHSRIKLPGSSLCYGLADGVSKGIALVWGIWCLVGPDPLDVQYFVDKVISITTDSGVEMTTLTLPSLLPAFYRWAQGWDLASVLPYVRYDSRLFQHSLRIQGWSHTWGNIMKAVAHSSTRWPVIEQRLRAQIVFF